MDSFKVQFSERTRRTRYNAKFRTKTTELVFSLTPVFARSHTFSVVDIIKGIRTAIAEIIDSSLDFISQDDRVWLVLSHKDLDRPISVPMVKRSMLTADLLCERVMRVAQSKKELLFDGLLSLSVISTSLPQGGGGKGKRSKDAIIDFTVWLRKCKYVIKIDESSNDCLPRAICISKAKIDGLEGNEWDYLKRNRQRRLEKASKKLCKDAGVVLGSNGATYDDLVKFQEYLAPDYQLIVVTPTGGNNFYFRGIPAEKQIFVIYHDNHYDSLTSIRAFLKRDYWCRNCLKGFNDKGNHQCDHTCTSCFGSEQCIGGQQITCEQCNRIFVSDVCFRRHKEVTKVCGKYFFCEACEKHCKKSDHHLCGHYHCKTCDKQVPYGHHKCYIEPKDEEKMVDQDAEPRIHVFFDIESMFVTKNSTEIEHKPNLVVAKTCCSECWNRMDEYPLPEGCVLCDQQQVTFYGESAVEKFCEWLFNEYEYLIQANSKALGIKQVIDCIVFAHNARSYDAILIINYLLSSCRKPSSIIKNGQKILTMKVGRYKFLDSIAFITMPLRNFAETFGLASGKGMFPYLMNTPENQSYEGPWPDKSLFALEEMKGRTLETFEKWYQEQAGKPFNLKDELIKYCEQDVLVLMKGVQCFQELLLKTTGINPYTRNLTLTSFVMSVYRAQYLPADTLAIPPVIGYEPERQQSHIANVWLDYMEQTENIKIQREVHLGRFYADGYHPETRHIYEFFGCYWHGCLKCFPTRRNVTMNNVSGLSMSQLAEGNKKKLAFYTENQWDVTVIYECELYDQLKACLEMREYFEKRGKQVRKPIDVRDAFYGGRVETIKFLHEGVFGEKIMYYDINSLYPYILKSRQFPKGHPEIIYDHFDTIDQYEGLIQARILPPRGLFHPLLPSHINDKLMYVLCQKCAEDNADSACCHDDEHRMLTGTWVLAEVKKAVELGYVIEEILCIWHFKEFATDKHGNNVFEEYINKWMKIKLQASGWPRPEMTDDEKNSYIEEIRQYEGIDLEEDKIEKRKDLRTVGKLCANGFYGKFAERTIRSRTKFIDKPCEFFELLEDNTVEVQDVIFVNDEVLQITYVPLKEFVSAPPHASVIQACYVTAYARLHLYSYLEQLQDRVFYMDTDSVIFSYQAGDPLPSKSMRIGDMSDEIKDDYGPGAYIKRFCSIGCKSYCLEVINGSSVATYINKFKGITCGFATSLIVNFKNIAEIVYNRLVSYSVPQKRFKISDEYTISTQDFNKKLQFTFDKRRVLDDLKTEPFGY